MIAKLAAIAAFVSFSDAFVTNQPRTFRPTTSLNLEDHIADMIDKELDRLRHHKELQAAWHEKNEKVIERDIPQGFDFDESTAMEDIMGPRQRRKDKRLARDDPQAYCADRCVATGNCEVFEDIFDMSPKQVMTFCTECVLSDGEEPCDIPDAFLEGDLSKLSP